MRRIRLNSFLLLIFASSLLFGCETIPLVAERQITILATNDIHGGIEAAQLKDGSVQGGMAYFAGVVQAVRTGLKKQYGPNAGLLVLDAGDQFQGTLLSNYSEGRLMIDLMNAVGYDGAIPGNHDYDFGPHGWLDDKVNSTNPDKDPRSVIKDFAARAKFPLISANTYFKESLVDESGQPVKAENVGCKVNRGVTVDWSKARRPEFIQPYLLKEVAGVKVAVIGIDHMSTPNITTPDNVADLCFRDDFDTYTEVRRSLEDKADLFILVMHNGDAGNETQMSNMVKRLIAEPGHLIDAVVAGHTHFVNDLRIEGKVPAIQSGSGGARFGRIDLNYNVKTHTSEPALIREMGGIAMNHARCDVKAIERGMCNQESAGVTYEGQPVELSTKVVTLIARSRAELAPMANRELGVAEKPLMRDRIGESNLSNALTDSFRLSSGADIAFMNTGGLRTDIPEGKVTYSQLFEVLPFSNHGLVIAPLTAKGVLELLDRSAKTCGKFGALMQSGLRVQIQKDCSKAVDGLDGNAVVTHVETLTGEVILDAASGVRLGDERTFRVATLDFLASGGDGFNAFKGVPVLEDMGILREKLVEQFLKEPVRWTGNVDGRWIVTQP